MIPQHAPSEAFVICSDSLRVICVLQAELETNANLGDARELLAQWMHVKESVRLQHVRAHKGDNANEMADAQKQENCRKQLFLQTVLLPFSDVLFVMRTLAQFSFVWFFLIRSSSLLC